MTTRKPSKTQDDEARSAERLASLLRDLETLQGYLQERGRHSYDLAQRFLANARRDAGSRAYDERQATMLEYQHYIWHEIAGRVSQLLVAYGEPDAPLSPETPELAADADNDADNDADKDTGRDTDKDGVS